MKLATLVRSLWPPFGGGTGTVVPTTPQDLFAALFTVLATDDDLTTNMGRSDWLWRDLAPPDTPLPWAVWTDVDRSDEVLLGSGHRAAVSGHVQITVYAPLRTQARALARQVARAIEAASDASTLTSDEWTGITIARAALPLALDQLDPDPGPDGADVWSHVLAYAFLAAESQS